MKKKTRYIRAYLLVFEYVLFIYAYYLYILKDKFFTGDMVTVIGHLLLWFIISSAVFELIYEINADKKEWLGLYVK